MFWHISLNMIDFVFDNLTALSLTIHKFGLTIQAIKLYKLLSYASSEFIISYGAGGHGFFRLDWISFDIEHAYSLNVSNYRYLHPLLQHLLHWEKYFHLQRKHTQSCQMYTYHYNSVLLKALDHHKQDFSYCFVYFWLFWQKITFDTFL